MALVNVNMQRQICALLEDVPPRSHQKFASTVEKFEMT